MVTLTFVEERKQKYHVTSDRVVSLNKIYAPLSLKKVVYVVHILSYVLSSCIYRPLYRDFIITSICSSH